MIYKCDIQVFSLESVYQGHIFVQGTVLSLSSYTAHFAHDCYEHSPRCARNSPPYTFQLSVQHCTALCLQDPYCQPLQKFWLEIFFLAYSVSSQSSLNSQLESWLMFHVCIQYPSLAFKRLFQQACYHVQTQHSQCKQL